MTQHAYAVFGLRIAVPSTLHSAQLTPVTAEGGCDVVVRYASVPTALTEVVAERFQPLKAVQVVVGRNGEVLWSTPFGRFLAFQGSTVDIELTDAALEPSILLWFVLSHCIPAVLIQRGILALHANAVATPTGAVVIGGASGAGKSTLLAGLVARGAPMLSDDVTAIRSAVSGRAHVLPGFPHYRLCADALGRLSPPTATVSPLAGLRNKFSIAVPMSAFHAKSAPLRGIYLIETHASDAIEVQPLQGAAKLRALRAVSFTPLWFTHLPSHVAMLAAIASASPVFQLRRPVARWTLDEMIDAVMGGAHERLRSA